jgi:hypothetical protein
MLRHYHVPNDIKSIATGHPPQRLLKQIAHLGSTQVSEPVIATKCRSPSV